MLQNYHKEVSPIQELREEERAGDLQQRLRFLLRQPPMGEEERQLARQWGAADGEADQGLLVLIQLVELAKGGNLTAFRELRSLLEQGAASQKEVCIFDDISS